MKLKFAPLSLIIMLFAFVGAPQVAQAGVVGTQSLMPQALVAEDQAQTRATIRDQLVELGVTADEADARVARLSDQQIADINAKLAEMPAGASVGGTLLVIFLVLVITDIAGVTDIFPFIHPAQ